VLGVKAWVWDLWVRDRAPPWCGKGRMRRSVPKWVALLLGCWMVSGVDEGEYICMC